MRSTPRFLALLSHVWEAVCIEQYEVKLYRAAILCTFFGAFSISELVSVTYSTDVTCLSCVGGKVPSYGEWKAGHQEEGLYCIYMWSMCGEVRRAEGELKES